MQYTRNHAIRLFAQRLGISQEMAEKEVDNRSSRWTTFATEMNIEIRSDKDELKSILGTTAVDIDAVLERQWNSIKTVQAKIEETIDNGNVKELKELSSSLTALHKSFLELGEIKRQHDQDIHHTVSRDVVETIIQGCFPELKKGLEEMFTRIKGELPEEQRAGFDISYQRHLPDYGKHLQKTVDKLNALLEG